LDGFESLVVQLLRQKKLNLPIIESVANVFADSNSIQDAYSKLMAKKTNKHADPINHKADASEVKPYG